MRRLPLLALAALVAAAGPLATTARASTVCVQNVCVCTDCNYQLPDDLCVRVDVDGDGHYETVCL
jgi:hypothetical protein